MTLFDLAIYTEADPIGDIEKSIKDKSWDEDYSYEKGETECYTRAYSQESADLNSELESAQAPTSTPQPLWKSITRRRRCYVTDSLMSPSIAISGTIVRGQGQTCTQLASPVQELATPEKGTDLSIQNLHYGLKPYDASKQSDPNLSSSSNQPELSIEDYEQFLADCEWLDIVGIVRKSLQQRSSAVHKKESASSLLPTPTTYGKGSKAVRPNGTIKLELALRKSIQPTDKLHPAAPGWMMGFPPGWVEKVLMDGGGAIHLPLTPEYLDTQNIEESHVVYTPDPFALSKQRSQSSELSTSGKSLGDKSVKALTSRIRSGSLAPYLENKKLKNRVATYPKVAGERDPLNYHHWRWGYYYEIKVGGDWKNRTIAVSPSHAHEVRLMIDKKYEVEEIISWLKNLK